MKNVIYLVIGCFLCISCGDFLKEYSKELTYASSCKDLDEVMIGNGYMRSRNTTSTMSSSLITKSELYYPWLFVMDDDIEEYATGTFNVTSEGPFTLMRPFYGWQKVPFQSVKGVPYDDPCWKKLYEHIGYLNVILSEIKEFTHESEEDINRITGEAEFLRGAYYYLLVNMYAKPYVKATAASDMGVPLNITEKIEDKYFKRESLETIYKQIVTDLTNAANHLAGIEQPTIYRVNETTVRILLSRVYLYMGEWALAEAESEKAIRLGCPLWDLNGFDMTETSESTGNLKQQYMISSASPEVLFTQGMNVLNLLMYDGLTVGRFRVTDELLELYAKYEAEGVTDLRREGYFSVSQKKNDCYFCRKNSVLSQDITAFDAFVIRSAEAYLNKAEAQAMQGKGEAVQTLKVLLEKRFENGVVPVTIDGLQGENLVKFVREERRRELCFECHRWFDLRRYAVCEKYPERKEIRHALYGPSSVFGGVAVYEGEYLLKPYGEDAAWVMPIPDYEITYNKGEMKPNEERVDREVL